jgi:hypothetical protein
MSFRVNSIISRILSRPRRHAIRIYQDADALPCLLLSHDFARCRLIYPVYLRGWAKLALYYSLHRLTM